MPENPYAPPIVGDDDKVSRDAVSRLTPAAMLQGAKNALICAVPCLFIWLVMRWGIRATTNWSPMVAGMYGFVLLFLGCVIAMLVGGIRARRRRGDLLMDCGPNPGKLLFVLNAVIFLLMSVSGFFQGETFGRGSGLFGIVLSLYWCYMATTRLAIYDSGVWAYTDLVPWEKFKGAKWQGGNTLIFETRGRLRFLRRGALVVPQDRVDEFRILFQQNVELETEAQND